MCIVEDKMAFPDLPRLVAIMLAAVLVGCQSSDQSDELQFESRDSAGINIVTSHGPSWSEGEAWHIEPEPTTQIGLGSDDAQHFLNVQQVRLRSDGSVLVLDGSSELRVFRPDGSTIGILARPGDGPGELVQPLDLYVLPGDTILVWDRRPGPNLFDPDGSFLGREVIDFVRVRQYMPEAIAIGHRGLSDGSVLAVGYTPPPEPTGKIRNRMLFMRSTIDGLEADTLGTSLDREWWVSESGEVQARTILGPASSWTAGGDPLRIAIGETGTSEVLIYEPDGRLERILRFPDADRSVPPDVLEAVRSDRRSLPIPNPNLERFFVEAPETTSIPSFGGLLLDRDGYLWILPYFPDEGEEAWDVVPEARVLDPTGRLLGTVTLPPRFVVHDVGHDWIAGVARTELGVEIVQVHALNREAGR
jgi:hypothetical protein